MTRAAATIGGASLFHLNLENGNCFVVIRGPRP